MLGTTTNLQEKELVYVKTRKLTPWIPGNFAVLH